MTITTTKDPGSAPKDDPKSAWGTPEFISIILPVRNESQYICSTLDMLVSQNYPSDRFEIIVVDGESTDNTKALCEPYRDRYPNVRLFDNANRLSSSARNIGVRESRGAVVVMVDGHCEIPDQQFLINLSDAFQQSKASIIGRPQPLKVTNPNRVQRAIALARASWLGHHPDSFIYEKGEQFTRAASVGVAYRQEVFGQIGYFDESFDACEDVDFNTRADKANLSCYFSSKVRIHYQPRKSLYRLFQQMNRYGKGRVRLSLKHRQFAFKSFIPFFFLIGLLVGPLTFVFSPVFVWIYTLVVSAYIVALMATSFTLGIKHQMDLVPVLPWVFATIHIGAGWGILSQLLRTPFLKTKTPRTDPTIQLNSDPA